MIYLASFVLLVVLLAIGLPVSFTLLLLGVFGLFATGGVDALFQIPGVMYKSLDTFTLVAIPLYVFLGEIMLQTGLGQKIFKMANSFLRQLPGGEAVATVASCGFFAAISGSSMTTAATIGSVAVPEMLNLKYKRGLTFGSVAAGGTLGILIPPSLAFIMYSAQTDVSAGQLFMAGFIPGILLCLIFAAYVMIVSYRERPPQKPAPFQEKIACLKEAWGVIPLPIIILGGIYTGLFTPTEAAAVGVVYLLVYAFAARELNWERLKNAMVRAANTTSMLMSIVVGALLLGHFLTIDGLPMKLASFVESLGTSPMLVVIAMNIIWLIMGFFLETISIMLITLPVFYPMVVAVGIDPIWLGVIMVVNMEIALITPPVGMNLYALAGVFPDAKIEEVAKGIVPFLILMILFLVLLMVFPGISTWLPAQMKL